MLTVELFLSSVACWKLIWRREIGTSPLQETKYRGRRFYLAIHRNYLLKIV